MSDFELADLKMFPFVYEEGAGVSNSTDRDMGSIEMAAYNAAIDKLRQAEIDLSKFGWRVDWMRDVRDCPACSVCREHARAAWEALEKGMP